MPNADLSEFQFKIFDQFKRHDQLPELDMVFLLPGWNQNSGTYLLPLTVTCPADDYKADLRVSFGGAGAEQAALFVEGQPAEFYRAAPSANFVNFVGLAGTFKKGLNHALLVVPVSGAGGLQVRLADPRGQAGMTNP
jgi:hypothetical protein